MLRHVDGEPRLGLEQTDGIPVVKMSPDKEVSGYGIPAIDVNFYRIFMRHPQIVSRKETAAAPRLLSGWKAGCCTPKAPGFTPKA